MRQADDVRELNAARWWFTFGNRRFLVARVVQLAERLERDGRNDLGRRTQIIFLGVLFIVGGVLEAAGVATKKIDLLGLFGERLQLQREWLCTGLEF
jgi:hypothetical protein